MYTPVNTSFTIYKWGLRGPKLYRYVFLMSLTVFNLRIRTDKQCNSISDDTERGVYSGCTLFATH